MSLQFIANGRTFSADELTKAAPKKAARKSSAPDSFHKGFAVEGYAPGHLAEAERIANQLVSDWGSMDQEQQARAVKQGRRPPKPWNLMTYLNTVKPKRVRFKPYEVLSAADECAELARKAGWDRVQVVPILKGEAKPGQMF